MAFLNKADAFCNITYSEMYRQFLYECIPSSLLNRIQNI